MIRNNAYSATSTNLALELTHTAKIWLLDLIQITLNPPPSTFSTLTSLIPFNRPSLTEAKENNSAYRAPTLSFYLEEIRKTLFLRNNAQELDYLNKLKKKLEFSTSEKEKKILFLLGYYDVLDQLTSDFLHYTPDKNEFRGKNSPRLKIIRALKDYHASNENLAAKVGLHPALLDKELEKQELASGQKSGSSLSHSSTKNLRFTFDRDSHLQKMAALQIKQEVPIRANEREKHPPNDNNPRSKRAALETAQPTRGALPSFGIKQELERGGFHQINEEKTLEKYHLASKKFSYELLKSVKRQLAVLYHSNKNHLLFKLLQTQESHSGDHLAATLLDFYYAQNTNQPSSPYSWQYQSPENIPLQIDIAINTLSSEFHLTWKRYKIVQKLQEAKTVSAFHTILNEDKNKEILTKRQDSCLMTFVKICGLVVASILGLPLGIVGGAYLSYQTLFGAKATPGRLYLQKIDQITRESQQTTESAPQNRR